MTDIATPDLRNGQSEVDVLTRHGIPLEFGDRTFRVRPRTMKKDREWLDLVFERVTSRIQVLMGTDFTVPDVIGALGDSPADMLALIVAYDETSQLPPPEWFEEHAYTAQMTAAFTTLLEVAHPPFAVSRRLLPADRAARIIGAVIEFAIERAARDGSFEPTDSPSPNGDTEPPKPSKRRSRTGSSRS